MDALPYYKWYWIDYRANRKVQRMSWQARGLYRELLDELWSEGFLPIDTEDLAEICGCDHDSFLTYWSEIEPSFEQTEHGYINRRMESQRTSKDSHRVKMANAGRSGAFAKAASANASKSQDENADVDSKEVVANASKCQQMPYSKSISKSISIAAEEKPAIATVTHQATEAARIVMRDAPLSGSKVLMALEQVARHAISGGVPWETVAAQMLESWVGYKMAAPSMKYVWGAEKFFGEDNWRDPKAWPWLDGKAPRPAPAQQRNVLKEIEEREAKALAEIEAENSRA